MPIYSKRRDIVDVAPEIAQAMALWLRSGFNGRHVTWAFRIRDEFPKLIPLTPDCQVSAPWQAPHVSLWQFTTPVGHLEYLYVFSNPDNAHATLSLNEVRKAIFRCLDALSARGIYRIAMIHIPVAAEGRIPTADQDRESAHEMINAPEAWQTLHPAVTIDVTLVDRNDDFSQLL